MTCQDRPAGHLERRPPFDAIHTEITLRKKRILLSGPVSPEKLSRFRPAAGLNCFRPASRQLRALVSLAGQPDGLIFIATVADTVISYASFQKPDFPWWQTRLLPCLLELGGLETEPAWRKTGVTGALLRSIFINPWFDFFEHFIVFTIQSVYNWDIKGTGLDPWSYRRLMIRFLGRYGFTQWETVDPEVREHPCNILLARAGSAVEKRDKIRFARCCMGEKAPGSGSWDN